MARSNAVICEAVEARTMMSASVLPHVAASNKTAIVQSVNHVSAPKLAEPALFGSEISYKNFSDSPLFAKTGPSISDISQGELGDCYLLATLSSIVKTDAALIKQDVVANENGTFSVKFNGGHNTVTVDAELPTLSDGQLAYAQAGAGGSIWVAVVEKAYAEYKNAKAPSYTAINGGWMSDAFGAFGLKSQTITTKTTAAALMSTVAADFKANDFVTFGTTTNVAKPGNLIGSHAYEVDHVNYQGGKAVSITLRNPWGNDVANGGYVTVTAAELAADFAGIVTSHA